MIVQVSTAAYIWTELLTDATGTPVTTKVNGNWTKTATLLGAGTTATPTITHRANGYYDILCTFPTVGVWSVEYSVVVNGTTVLLTPLIVQVVTAAQFDPVSALQPSIELANPIAESGLVTIKIGDDYLDADGRALVWTEEGSSWPDLTDAVVTLGAKQRPKDSRSITGDGTVLVATGDGKSVSIDLPKTQTMGKSPGVWLFDVQAVIQSGSTVTLFSGALNLVTDYAT